MKKFDYKVPDGKLLKIRMECGEGRIESIKILGDFFAYPEECIEQLEKDLKNCPFSDMDERIKKSLDNAELFGVTPEAISTAIMEARSNE